MGVLKLTRQMRMIAITAVFAIPLLASAATPLWTITPSTSLPQKVGKDERVTIKYTVTNQSSKSHTLVMKDIQGVTVTPASCALRKGDSCEITLVIDGAKLGSNGITGGPVVCAQGNAKQCYQPSSSDQLKISPNASSTTSAPESRTTSSGTSYADLVKELEALLEDVEIEITDGTTGTAGSITRRIAQNDPMVKQMSSGTGKPEEVAAWIKTLIGTLNGLDRSKNSPEAIEIALKPTVDRAKFLLGLFATGGNSSPTQQTGTAATIQAIDDALRRSVQTTVPATSAPTPVPARFCYTVGTEIMCH